MAGAAPQGDDDAITNINLTPLVDVSLVLVIIFMAIAPFALQSGIKVLESKAKAAVGKVSASDNVAIHLTKDRKLTVNGKETAFEGLKGAVEEALVKSKDRMVILTADDENKVGDVVYILDTAKDGGAVKLAIMRKETDKEKAEAAKGGQEG
jgi:biopolymer transport protein ExbD